MATKQKRKPRSTKQRAAKSNKPPKAKGKCLCCDNRAQSRGLCWRCNAQAQASIRRGDTTEEKLIKAGLILPSLRKGRPAESGFAKRLAEIKK